MKRLNVRLRIRPNAIYKKHIRMLVFMLQPSITPASSCLRIKTESSSIKSGLKY